MDIKRIFPYYDDLPVNNGDYLRGKTIGEVVKERFVSASLCTGLPILSPSDPTYTEQYNKYSNSVNKKVSEYAAHTGERMFYIMVQGDLVSGGEGKRISIEVVGMWESGWGEFLNNYDLIRAVNEDYKIPMFKRKVTQVTQLGE